MQADEGAEVEIHTLIAPQQAAQLAEQAGLALVPVEVNADFAVVRLFGEADAGRVLIEGDFLQADATTARSGRSGRRGAEIVCAVTGE